MPMNNRTEAYSDVRDAFNYALVHNGGSYILGDKKLAQRWRHRAYYFRSLIRAQNGTGMSEYDELVVSVREASPDMWGCFIEILSWNAGTFIPADGRPLEPVAPEPANSKAMMLARLQGTALAPEHHAAINDALGILAEPTPRAVDTVTEEDADAWARGEE
jgi:hypothetical protein